MCQIQRVNCLWIHSQSKSRDTWWDVCCAERLRPVASADDEHICCRRSISTPPFYTICIEQRLIPSEEKAAGLGWKDPGSLGVGTREVF